MSDETQIFSDISSRLNQELGDAWSSISGYAERQAKLLAHQSSWITKSRVSGSLRTDDELFNFFTKELADSAEAFAKTIALQTILTLEKAWNAIVDVVWNYINGALTAAGLYEISIPVHSDN